jgi:hypothetical protein
MVLLPTFKINRHFLEEASVKSPSNSIKNYVNPSRTAEVKSLQPDIDDIDHNILLAHNIDVLRHIVVLLLCIVEES